MGMLVMEGKIKNDEIKAKDFKIYFNHLNCKLVCSEQVDAFCLEDDKLFAL